MEIIDNRPEVNVQAAEYLRLLGYPRGFVLEGRALELAEEAREWFARHGRPWVYARSVDSVGVQGDSVTIDDATFHGRRLPAVFESAGADRAFIVAVTAGPELEEEAQARWREGKPDEYFFLE